MNNDQDINKRKRYAVFFLIILFALSNVNLLRTKISRPIQPINTHPISRYVKRFDPIKKFLPSHGKIGYISDDYFKEHSGEKDTASIQKYVLTRYSLAPLLIINNHDHKLVIGNFHEIVPLDKLKKMGFVLVKNAENGVMLFQKESL